MTLIPCLDILDLCFEHGTLVVIIDKTGVLCEDVDHRIIEDRRWLFLLAMLSHFKNFLFKDAINNGTALQTNILELAIQRELHAWHLLLVLVFSSGDISQCRNVPTFSLLLFFCYSNFVNNKETFEDLSYGCHLKLADIVIAHILNPFMT
jgi:hypothetical protein